MTHFEKLLRRASLMLLAIAALASCKDNKLTVKGDLTNTGDTLLVFGTGTDTPDTILVKDGKFTYQMEVNDVHGIYIVRPETAAINLLAVPGEKAEVTGDMMGDYTISGTKFFRDYNAQQEMLKEATQENVVDLIMNYTRENPDNEAVCSMISIMGYVAPDSLDTFLGLISDKVKNGRMKAFVDEQLENARAQMESEAQSKALQAEGREAPDFTLNDLGGKPLTLSSLRGKHVILDFWGSWCGWCIKGFPEMKEYYQKYKGQFEILGIDCSDSDQAWRDAVKEHELPWLHVYNPEGSELLAQYGIQGFPTKIILDPEGKIVKTIVGEDPAFYTLLDELFGKK
ncbi:MAG: AhpC/TSA family protein [Bacteroidaceae bacterium]|nr:AhpC/TSA family protein [Bacteroidaceae bacterium]